MKWIDNELKRDAKYGRGNLDIDWDAIKELEDLIDEDDKNN